MGLWAYVLFGLTILKGSIFGKEIPFCHENAIEGNFGSNGISSSLLLHASYSNISDAIGTPARGTERCTCYVTALGFIDILNIGLLHYPEQSEKECTKKIDVMRDGALQATSGCSTEKIELYGLRPDTTVTLTLSASKDFTLLYKELDQVMVAIAPDETSPLKVSCDKPYQSEGTVSSTSTAMTSSTSAKPNVSTTTLSTNEGSKNKSAMMVGLIVGLGIPFLIVVCCFFCFVLRRKTRDQSTDGRKSAAPDVRTGFRYRLRRTMTVVHDKLRARPLPKIPLTSRVWQRQVEMGSGVYCSIRSERSAAGREPESKVRINKQESCQSLGSNLEPFSVSAILDSGGVIGNSVVTNNTYLNPVSSKTSVDKNGNTCPSEDAIYTNTNSGVRIIKKNSSETENDAKIQNGDIVKLCLAKKTASSVKGENNTLGHIQIQTRILKSPVIQVDSHGYVPMKKDLKKLLEHSPVSESVLCETGINMQDSQNNTAIDTENETKCKSDQCT